MALHFKENPLVKVFVGSEGPGADWLIQRKDELNLSNLTIMGYQPMEKFPQILATGDVLVTILEPEAGLFSVPSKTLSYLCAGRPQLLSIQMDNLVAKIVVDHQAGLAVPSGDVEAFIQSAERLVADPALREACSRNARKYAEQTFNIRTIGDRFESIMNAVA
jgi:putative colanic acid biosynthesis glycosyltransferase WcaI